MSLVKTGNPKVKLLLPVASVVSSPSQKIMLNRVLVALKTSYFGPILNIEARDSKKDLMLFLSSENTSVISPFFLTITTSSAPA